MGGFMLKKDTYEYGAQKVEIFELSGMQRIDYLTVIEKETTTFDALPEDASEIDRNRAFSAMRLRINAWLVAASLWHADKKQDIGTLQKTIQGDWSGVALAECSMKILEISSMMPVMEAVATSEVALVDDKEDTAGVSVEKY